MARSSINTITFFPLLLKGIFPKSSVFDVVLENHVFVSEVYLPNIVAELRNPNPKKIVAAMIIAYFAIVVILDEIKHNAKERIITTAVLIIYSEKEKDGVFRYCRFDDIIPIFVPNKK